MPAPSYGRSPREQTKRESRKNLKGLVRDHFQTCIGLSVCGSVADVSKSNVKTDPSCDDCSNGGFWEDWSLNVGDTELQSSTASKRQQSRILDRWAARQAEEMITTIDRQAYEAELQALSSAHPVSTRASSFMRETSPARSECSIELPNLRASSLVQMWRELEAEAAMTVENRTSSVNSAGSGATNAASFTDNGSSNEHSENCDSADDRNGSPMTPDDSFIGWESDAASQPVSDAGESERGRVSYMVRRLNSFSGRCATNSSLLSIDEIEREQCTARGTSGPSSNGNRRLIRGHQESRDLLMRIGHDRKKELARVAEQHTVSHFSHRSRIQALLRFKLLQRVTIHEHTSPTSTTSELDQLQQRTSISQLRERFSPRSEHDSCSNSTQLPVRIVDSEHSGLTDYLSNENVVDNQEISTRNHSQEGTQLTPHSLPLSEYLQESSQSPDFVLEERRLSILDLDLQANMSTSLHNNALERDAVTEETESNSRQHVETECNNLTQSTDDSFPQRTRDSYTAVMHQEEQASQSSDFVWHRRRLSIDDIDWHGTANAVAIELGPNHQLHVEVGYSDEAQSTDVSHPQRTRDDHSEAICHNWLASISNNEEVHAMTLEPVPDTQDVVEVWHTDPTWFADPQSTGNGNNGPMYQDWLDSDNEEGDAVRGELHPNTQQGIGVVGYMQRTRSSRDEAMYQAWLERISDNEEMLALLSRRSVSNTLASDFRVRMDRLMSSHLQIHENRLFMDDGIAEEQIPHEIYYHEDQTAEQIASPSTQLPLPSQFFDHQDSSSQNSPFMHHEEQNSPQLYDDHHEEENSPLLDDTGNVNEVASPSIQLPLPPFRFLHHEDSQNSPLLRDDEASNVSQVEPISAIQFPSPSQFLDSQTSPQLNSSIPSLELELISDLRENMLRLHQDMCELRRSIASCINMQAQLQRSIKQEVSAAHSAESSENPNSSSTSVSTRKGSCCICYEMPIDSLLYRCGHMCTCYKCAHELQWSSGICPICRAPIVDVVRAYSDT